MTDEAKPPLSDVLRSEGNTFYKKGKLSLAAEKYRAAAKVADHTDALPLSNLSAVFFELGRYEDSIEAANRALNIDNGADDRTRKKLLTRIAQAMLHLGRTWEGDLTTVPESFDDDLTSQIVVTCARLARSQSQGDAPLLWKIIGEQLPRYKVAMWDKPAWSRFGHDTFESLFDRKLGVIYGIESNYADVEKPVAPVRKSKDKISFFLGGIGDARHFYSTLIQMGPPFATSSLKEVPGIHFVLNDYDPHVFARNLIIWYWLDGVQRVPDGPKVTKLLSSIYYVFCAPAIPPQIFDYLQRTISHCIKMLLNESSMPKWLVFPEKYRSPVIAVLKTWQKEVPDLYTVSEFHEGMMRALIESPIDLQRDNTGMSPQMQVEEKCYYKTLFLRPDETTMNADPQLRKLYQKFSKDQTKFKKLRAHIAETWHVNPTLFDLEHEKRQENIGEMYPEPWNLPDSMYGPTGLPSERPLESLHEYLTMFFQVVASSLALLGNIVTVHVSLGDAARQFEQIRYLGDDSGLPNLSYDRIHLSNIPDYTGMDLFTCLYAVPHLKPHKFAYATFNCLACVPRWKTLKMYNADSHLLYKKEDLARGLNVEFAGFSNGDEDTFVEIGFGQDYYRWRSIRNSPRDFESLLPRSDFNHWLCGLFLHLALPAERDHDKHLSFGVSQMVWKPLNLTVFLRLLIHLRSIGYPSHWMGQILVNILTDNLITAARPPSKCPVPIEEISRRAPPKNFSTAPFLAEMSTLAAQFLRVLPFAALLCDGVIPEPEGIRECTVRWLEDSEPPAELSDAVRADFILVFARDPFSLPENRLSEYTNGLTKLRHTLTNKEFMDRFKDSIHVVTTWKWDREKREGTFWLREDILEQIKDGDLWKVEIWRTDSWRPLNLLVPFQREVEWRLGRTWADLLKEERSWK